MEVISGCVNLSGVLKVRVDKPFSESTAAKIIKLVEDAGENKSRGESFIRRFARVYTPIVVISALAWQSSLLSSMIVTHRLSVSGYIVH